MTVKWPEGKIAVGNETRPTLNVNEMEATGRVADLSLAKRIGLSREMRIYISLLVVIILLALVSGVLVPGTLTASHLLEIARQAVPLGITAIGHTFVILTGGIDLAVGDIITMTNIVGTDLMRGRAEAGLPVSLLLLFIGAGIGAISGAIIAYGRVQPLVTTFGMSFVVRGFYLVYSGGTPKGSVSPILRTIGAGRWGAVPISLVVFCVIVVAAIIVANRTTWGRSVFYMGNNPQAALYSGVPVGRRLVFAYSMSGLMASLAGLILSGYIRIASFEIGGADYTLNSVAAGVIGGNTFTGQGGIFGSVLGALIMTQVTSLMTSMGIGQSGKLIMNGIIIVGMVALYSSQMGLVSSRRKRAVKGDEADDGQVRST